MAPEPARRPAIVKSVISTLIAGLYFIVPPFHVFLETHISSLP